MKGLISGIKRMEIHDGEGLRTTVFFKGCPLKCIWCHNPESISFESQIAVLNQKCMLCGTCKEVCKASAISYENEYANIDFTKCNKCFDCVDLCPTAAINLYGKEYTADELVDILLQDKLFFKNGNGGVTLSGGECLAQPEFAIEVAKKLKENGISVYIDTCGFVKKEVFESILPYTDKFLYDIKAANADVHKKCTGTDNTIILSNLHYLCESGADIEIRYPLIKGFNDSECESIGQLLSNLKGIKRIKVLQYHPFAASRYESLGMQNTLPNTRTTFEDVENAVKTLKSFGLNAVNGIVSN